MRTKFWGTVSGLIVMMCISTSGASQTIKEVIERYWSGSAEQYAEFIEGGKLYSTHSLKLTFYDNNTISGTSTVSMNLDGYIYYRIAQVSGTCNSSDQSLYISESYVTRADALPDELYWCKQWGTLYLYSNSEAPGHYILRGTYTDDCGGSTAIEYTEY